MKVHSLVIITKNIRMTQLYFVMLYVYLDERGQSLAIDFLEPFLDLGHVYFRPRDHDPGKGVLICAKTLHRLVQPLSIVRRAVSH